MDDASALGAVLTPPQQARFRQLCDVDGTIEPRFSGFTKLVLLTADRAFLFPRNHLVIDQLERECEVYATLEHPMVPRLLGRWHDGRVSPYPFFAVTRLAGSGPAASSAERLPTLAAALGVAIAACHDTPLARLPPVLWANAWTEPPATPPTALECFSPLREVGGAERIAAAAASFIRAEPSVGLLGALFAVEALEPVLAHGDLHEDQLLLDPTGLLTGILDWGFGGVLSPLCDFTFSQFGDDTFASEAGYGDARREMWGAYAACRAAPLPAWEHVELALTSFDVVALGPDTGSHYYWQKSEAWRAARRIRAGDCLRSLLA